MFLGLLLLAGPGWAFEPSDTTKSEKKLRIATYPVIGYQPETSFLLGSVSFVVFNLSDSVDTAFNRPSSVAPVVIATFNNQLIITPRVELNFTNRYQLKLKPTYRFYPNEFYGTGSQTERSDLEFFDERKLSNEVRFYRIFNRKLFTGLAVLMEHNTLSKFDPEGQLVGRDILGETGGFNIGAGPSITFDNRDDILFPTHGDFLNFEAIFYPDIGVNEYHYRFYQLDLRQYHLLWGRDVVALRMRLSGQFGGEAPFYQYPKLGGSQRLRGIRANQYIDSKAYMVQGEYRMTIHKWLGANFSCGIGDVAHELSGFQLSNMKYSGAVGLRIRLLKKEKLNLALDYGLANGGQNGFYLAIGEAF